jgi:hypothetical protein
MGNHLAAATMTGVSWRRAAFSMLCLLVGSFRASGASLRPVLAVQAPAGLERAAAAVQGLAALDWDSELEITGCLSFPSPIRVVLLPESSQEARTTPTWVSAYAMGAVDTIVIFPARVPSYPDRNLETLLRHEVTHLLIDQAAGGRPVPRWLHEGIATVAAREWGIEDGARFALAVIGQRPHSTSELDDAFSAGAGAAARSYALSAALTRYLRRQFGPDTPAHILRKIALGHQFPEAFALATGRDLHEVEHDFFGREAFWGTWVPFLTSSAVLWMAITLLAMVAIHRRRQRDLQMQAAWAAEEGTVLESDADLDEEEPGDGSPWRYN